MTSLPVRTLPVLAAAALLAFAATAHGQPAPIALPEVTVPLPPEDEVQVDPASPARRDPTGAISVVSVKDQAAPALETAQLVAAAPGVTVQDFGPGQTKTISIRGAGASGVLVLLDGVPLNGAGGVVDLSLIPLPMLDRLEVLGGAAGARYGSGGLGGAVNLVTPEVGRHVRLFARGTYGSFTTERGELSAELPAFGGGLLLSLHGTKSAGDFRYWFDDKPQLDGNTLLLRTRENNQSQQGAGLLKWTGTLGGGQSTVLLEGSLLSRGLPGTETNPSPSSTEQTEWGALSLRHTQSFDGGEWSVRAFGKQEASRFANGYFTGGFAQAQAMAGAEVEGSALMGLHALTAQLSGAYEGLNAVGPRPLGVEAPENPRWGRGALQAMDEWSVANGVTLVPSLRLEQVGRFFGASPKLGARVELPQELVLTANAASAFRAPSFLELYVVQGSLFPNPALTPERALAVDVSLQRAFEHGEARVTAFGTRYLELISYEFSPPFLSRPENLGGALAVGTELQGEWRPRPWLSGSAAYTFLHTVSLDRDRRTDGNALPYRPMHRLRARIEGGPAVLRAHLVADVQSAQFTNRTNTAETNAWALLDAGVSLRLLARPELTLSAEVRNVLDMSAQSLDGYPLPGRAFFASLGFLFDPSPEGSLR